MTARALIDRRFRVVMFVVYAGGGLFLTAMVADKALGFPDWIWVPGLMGFGAAWLTMAGAYILGLRCPACRANLTHLIMSHCGLRLSPKIHFCPYCSQDFDAECGEDRVAA